MRIGEREVGGGAPPYVVGEIGVNHDGDPERALELVDAAAVAGADAVKLQVFRADLLLSGDARLAGYQREAGERDPVEMLRRLELPLSACAEAVRRAHDRGLHAIATVFTPELVGEADALGFDAFKSASPDVVNRPLLAALEATGRPLIVSTGASTPDEVVRACGWLAGARERLALLQCVSAYPTRDADAALGGIGALRDATGLPVGYSDHTTGVDTGALAVAAGACALEKHLTYDRSAKGPDHAASLDPDQMREYVALARRAHEMLGGREKRLLDAERDVRAVSRQSLAVREPVGAGGAIERANLTTRRPAGGIDPASADGVAGRAAARDLPAGAVLREDDLA